MGLRARGRGPAYACLRSNRNRETLTRGRRRGGEPVGAFDDRWRFVGASRCQPLLFPAREKQQDGAEQGRCEARLHGGFLFDFLAQRVNLLAHAWVDLSELPLHHPERRTISAPQFLDLSREPLADAGIRIVLVAPPAEEHGPAHAIQARAVALEIELECPIQEFL